MINAEYSKFYNWGAINQPCIFVITNAEPQHSRIHNECSINRAILKTSNLKQAWHPGIRWILFYHVGINFLLIRILFWAWNNFFSFLILYLSNGCRFRTAKSGIFYLKNEKTFYNTLKSLPYDHPEKRNFSSWTKVLNWIEKNNEGMDDAGEENFHNPYETLNIQNGSAVERQFFHLIEDKIFDRYLWLSINYFINTEFKNTDTPG